MSQNQNSPNDHHAANPIADNQNSVTAGPAGPVDAGLSNCSKLPTKTVNAFRSARCMQGVAAYGTLTITHDITKYTKASVFAKVGSRRKCSPLFDLAGRARPGGCRARFARFCAEILTDEGNWDWSATHAGFLYSSTG